MNTTSQATKSAATFLQLLQRTGLCTAPCQDCGAGPDAPCDVDCPSQFQRDRAELGSVRLAVVVALSVLGVLVAGLLLSGSDPKPSSHTPDACAHALELADTLTTQHELVLDHVRAGMTARATGDHDAAVAASVAGQNALDAYNATVVTYDAAAASCRA